MKHEYEPLRLERDEIIDIAEAHGLHLGCYEAPEQEACEQITPDRARELWREDSSLVYLDVWPVQLPDTVWYTLVFGEPIACCDVEQQDIENYTREGLAEALGVRALAPEQDHFIRSALRRVWQAHQG